MTWPLVPDPRGVLIPTLLYMMLVARSLQLLRQSRRRLMPVEEISDCSFILLLVSSLRPQSSLLLRGVAKVGISQKGISDDRCRIRFGDKGDGVLPPTGGATMPSCFSRLDAYGHGHRSLVESMRLYVYPERCSSSPSISKVLEVRSTGAQGRQTRIAQCMLRVLRSDRERCNKTKTKKE